MKMSPQRANPLEVDTCGASRSTASSRVPRRMVGIASEQVQARWEKTTSENNHIVKCKTKRMANKWLGPGQEHRRHACSQKDVGDANSDA